MKKIASYAGAVLGLLIMGGCSMNAQEQTEASAEAVTETPAYLIISINELEPEKMNAYKEAMGPLAKKAGGIELLGFAQQKDIQLIDGNWDFPGILLIEKFQSMEALKSLYESEEYAEVKKLRAGIAEANFFIAIEGRPTTE